MKIHRFIGSFDFQKNTIKIEDASIIKQIRNVLRMEPGETIILFDGRGMEAEVVIESINSKSVLVGVISKKEIKTAGKSVSLYLAILKKENFEFAVQKSVECGVSKIIPVITERTVKTGLNMERLNKIIREAAEQCGQNFLPKLHNITNYQEALKLGEEADEKIIFHLGGENSNPGGVPSGVSRADRIAIFIGPEGGFTEAEVSKAKEIGYKVASLGPLTLRGETAAILATYRAVQGI